MAITFLEHLVLPDKTGLMYMYFELHDTISLKIAVYVYEIKPQKVRATREKCREQENFLKKKETRIGKTLHNYLLKAEIQTSPQFARYLFLIKSQLPNTKR